jgi:glycerol-3-phosphate dehydrogenase
MVRALMTSDASLATPLTPERDDVAAQVVFSTRHEWCVHLEDFMLRRSYLGFWPDRGLSAAPAVSQWMQRELGWTEPQRQQELLAYEDLIRRDPLLEERR